MPSDVVIEGLRTSADDVAILVCHADDVEMTVEEAETLRSSIQEEFPGHHVVLFCGGGRLEALTDDQLREIGLERIAR